MSRKVIGGQEDWSRLIRVAGEPSRGAALPGFWLESPYTRRLAARTAARYHLSPADVPDLLQELLIALWEADPTRPLPPAWLSSVATFKTVDMLRKRHLEDRSSPDPPSRRTPDRPVDSETVHLLHARIARLPLRMQAFWRLRYELSLTQEEIAVRLGVSRSSVRWLEARFLKVLGARKFAPLGDSSSQSGRAGSTNR